MFQYGEWCHSIQYKNENMSKRLWTETRQVGAKNSTQKLSKTKAKLSQAEPSQVEPS